MSRHQASVNGSNKDNPERDAKPVRKSRARKAYQAPDESPAGWALRYQSEYIYLAEKSLTARERARRRARERALRLAPETLVRIQQARARLEASHAANTANIPNYTLKFAGFVEQQAEWLGNPDAKLVYAASCAPIWADIRAQRAAILSAEVHQRLRHGYIWTGGGVAGNDDYHVEPFRLDGLVSDGSPILQLFVSKLRRAGKLRAGNTKAESGSTRSKLLACDLPYVEGNSRCCGIVRVEVDGVFPWSAIADACRAVGVPVPNVAVGWVDPHGDVHNPHLIWILRNSLPLEGSLCSRFRGIYRGISRGLTKGLLPLGADPGGLSNAHRHKNPLSPLWSHLILAEAPYEATELAQRVDTACRVRDLVAAAQALQPSMRAEPDHPDAEVATGSNAMFRTLAGWAKKEVLTARASGAEEAEFAGRVALEAYRLHGALVGNQTRAESTTRFLAARVATWTWNKYQPPAPKVRKTRDDAHLAEVRRRAGSGVAARRKERSSTILIAAALRLDGRGIRVTQVAVLEEVRSAGIKAKKTACRHWQTILDAVAEADAQASAKVDIRPSPVKKNITCLLGSNQAASPNPDPVSPVPPVGFRPLQPSRPVVPKFLLVGPVGRVPAASAPSATAYEDPDIPW